MCQAGGNLGHGRDRGDISAQESETLDRYLGESLDLVITICDDANEACPVFPGARERLRAFRHVRDEIRACIEGELAKLGV